MSAEEWQKRLFTERAEVMERHDKLLNFMMTEKFRELPAEHRDLMIHQSQVMHDYGMVLTRRILLLPRGVSYE